MQVVIFTGIVHYIFFSSPLISNVFSDAEAHPEFFPCRTSPKCATVAVRTQRRTRTLTNSQRQNVRVRTSLVYEALLFYMLVALAVQTQLHVESDTITATDVLYRHYRGNYRGIKDNKNQKRDNCDAFQLETA